MNDRPRVMIVDDDELLRETLAELVESEGLQAVLAENGEDALRRLRAEPHPRFIVLDLMMPLMSGVEFRRVQLTDPELSNIPVVILSAAHDARTIGEDLRAYDCFSKPIDLDRFVAVMKALCSS
jgi:CheY-like chemotaxis protein